LPQIGLGENSGTTPIHIDSSKLNRGLVRAGNGTITTFNDSGYITGYYEDNNMVFHGYVRTP
jgi:hypothetical protein